MLGLSHAAASGSALLLNTEGLAKMVIARIVIRENVGQRLIFGVFAILAGAVLLSWNGEGVSFVARWW
jgi:drug/metabolite transporter (DMT)-like permease